MGTRKIVFHHIPKCGGSTIAAGLALSYFPGRVLRLGRGGFSAHLNARAASAAADALGMDRYVYRRQLLEYHLACGASPLISGHYPFSAGAAERYGPEWCFISLFRNPVDRWYSEYYWNRYKDHDYARTELDLEAYLESSQGRADARSFLNFLIEARDPAAEPSSAEVQGALRALEKLDVVGVLEDMERFRSDLAVRFGYKPLFIKRNKSPAPEGAFVRADPGSQIHRTLVERLRADQEIYQAVLRRLGRL